ncbi:MAG TPA: hypothetical protein VK279_00765 [Solirubrobacteraceae bacterium]|nr:hypothetical protein [Solirubrobacteraceae bacterium]
MRSFLTDVGVPAVLGAIVLIVLDTTRDEATPWWGIALIFLVVFALCDGARYLARRRR